jgi:hypothetical protein
LLNKQQFVKGLNSLVPIVQNVHELSKGEVRFSVFADSGYEFRLKIYPSDLQTEDDMDYLGNLWEFAYYEFDLSREMEAFREVTDYSQRFSFQETLHDFEDLKKKLEIILRSLEKLEQDIENNSE